MGYSMVFSILLLASSIIAITSGIFVMQNNKNGKPNKCYFAVVITISFWSIGLAFANSAADIRISEFWRRFSSIGWSIIWGALLHFILVVTGHYKIFKTRPFHLVLYSPALITMLAFTLPLGLNPTPYKLYHTDLGWINAAANNIWDHFFYIYYFSYFVICTILLFRWGNKSKIESVKKQSRIILITFCFAFLLATITDVLSSLLGIHIPQMAPIFMLLPIFGIYYTIRKYGFLTKQDIDTNEIILNSSSIDKILDFIVVTFVMGSILNFLARWAIYRLESFFPVLILSLSLLAVAIILKFISKSNIDIRIKEIIIGTVSTAIIPFISLGYIENAGLTIWAVFFIFSVIALVLNRITLLIGITLSATYTQLLLWSSFPNVIVRINASDYLVRIGLIIIASTLAYFVNKIYLNRLKENAYKVKLQKLITEISNNFVAAKKSDFKKCLQIMIEKAALFAGCERAFIVLFQNEKTEFQILDWNSEGVSSLKEQASCQIISLLYEELSRKHVVVLLDEKLHFEEQKKLLLKNSAIKSLIALPIKKQGVLKGILCFNSSRPIKKWNLVATDDLDLIANITSDALYRIDSDEEIRLLAYYDQLTKLPNRILLRERLNQAINHSKQHGNVLGVMFLDLDSFKEINDSLGHEQGDEVLIEIAKILTSCIGESESVYRFGGDEFIIIFNNVTAEDEIIVTINNIFSKLRQPLLLKDNEFFITASAGLAYYPEDGEDADSLIKNADAAMYKAKSSGKNKLELFSDDLKNEAIEKIRLTNLLHRALDREQFVLYYQPQICIESQSIVGFEALIRWYLPDVGLISPAKFIPLAEHSGLIGSIGEWALKTACYQNKLWQDMGLPPVRVAVNVSAAQFKNPRFLSIITSILEETGLNPKYLEIEITESVVSMQCDELYDLMKKIKDIGISVAIDDFGTEYSSLSRLKNLPIDRIKMDMQFVKGIELNKKDQAIAAVIIGLAKSLGIKVIAEGIETAKQLAYLSRKMCDEVQGYYFYKPMPANEVESLMSGAVMSYEKII